MISLKRLLTNYIYVISTSFSSSNSETGTSNNKIILPTIKKQTLLEQTTRIISNARNIVVITGAGISADSGIPTYRSLTPSFEGIWNKAGYFKTAFYGSWIGWLISNNSAWKLYYKYYYKYAINAKPNDGHHALVDLYEFRKGTDLNINNMIIITQNVDRLHHKSGFPKDNIIEMHGNASNFKCNLCGSDKINDLMLSMIINEDFISPNCPRCKVGKARPAVVFFGERLKYSNILKVLDIFRNLNEKDVVIVIGTSLQVTPVAELPIIAINNGVPVIEINLEQHLTWENQCIEAGRNMKNIIFLQGNASMILPQIIKYIC